MIFITPDVESDRASVTLPACKLKIGLSAPRKRRKTCTFVPVHCNSQGAKVQLTQLGSLLRSTPPSLDRFDDDDKENCRPVYPFTRSYKRKRIDSRAMADNEDTPRPSKMQTRNSNPAKNKPFLPRPASSSSASTESHETMASHQSGRASPTKQMTILQDAEEPVVYYDFDSPQVKMAEDVQALLDGLQPLVDNRGILGHTVRERRSPVDCAKWGC